MKQWFLRLWTVLGIAALLIGCTIEGGVPPTPAPSAAAPLVQPTDQAAAEALARRADTWVIGLLEQPRDLYPYQPNPTFQRVAGPITELLFPSPILALNYGYTTTGVLEQVPTLENGGAAFRKADVYLDVAGNITTTVTEVITQVDQLVVTYRWNPDLRWSDGEPVTAADSVFAYEVAKVAPPNNEALDRLAATVEYVAVDEHTTQAVLQPDLIGTTYFLNYWTPLPRHLLEDVPPDQIAESEFAAAPVGYGPYMLDESTQEGFRLVRNRYYSGPPPTASQIDINLYSDLELVRASILNGNLDIAVTDRVPVDQFSSLDQDAADNLLDVTYLPNPIWEHIDFNLDVSLLKDYRIRRAIAFGTDRQAMADTFFNGQSPVLESWVLPNQAEAAPVDQLSRYPYDPDQARALLDEGGYVDADGDGIRSTPDGITLTLRLMTTENNVLRASIAERFQADMRAIGIDIEVLELPTETLFALDGPLHQRQFELALFGWGASPNAGGLSLWSCNSVPSERNGWTGENFAGWCFRDADIAIRTGATTLDVAERQAAYLRQQQLWTQELPALPLFQRLSVLVVAPEVRGPQLDAFAPITWNVAAWQREQ